MAKTKQRSHNEWFMKLATKRCRNCGTKATVGQVMAWGEYRYNRWNTVTHFCDNCFDEKVGDWLLSHAKDCGCEINLVPRSGETIAGHEKLTALQTKLSQMHCGGIPQNPMPEGSVVL